MIKPKLIILLIILFALLIYANPFFIHKQKSRLADSTKVGFYVVNPIPDQTMSRAMSVNDSVRLVVSDIFNTFTYSAEPSPILSDYSILSAEVKLSEDQADLFLDLLTNVNIGRTNVTFTAYGDSNATISSSDIFQVAVEDTSNHYQWFEGGSKYNFQHNLGTDLVPWKAATHFSLGSESYILKEIEFGFELPEKIEWKIVKFDEVPTDSIVGNYIDSLETNPCLPTYQVIDDSFSETILTGDIAIVFSTEGNFMSLDPNGESTNTWIWTEKDGWVLVNSYTSDYDGAWYTGIQLSNLATGIEETFSTGLISNFELLKNYPNPFNPTTEINFTLDENAFCKLTVFNSNGEMIVVLNNSKLEKGSHIFDFDGKNLNSGLYFYQLEVDGVRSTKKMILMK